MAASDICLSPASTQYGPRIAPPFFKYRTALNGVYIMKRGRGEVSHTSGTWLNITTKFAKQLSSNWYKFGKYYDGLIELEFGVQDASQVMIINPGVCNTVLMEFNSIEYEIIVS